MAGTVFDKGDQRTRSAAEFRFHLVHEITHELHKMEVRLLIEPSDVVGFTCTTLVQHEPECLDMIADVEPVAHVHAIAINGDSSA